MVPLSTKKYMYIIQLSNNGKIYSYSLQQTSINQSVLCLGRALKGRALKGREEEKEGREAQTKENSGASPGIQWLRVLLSGRFNPWSGN